MSTTETAKYLARFAYDNAQSAQIVEIYKSENGTEYTGARAEEFAFAENAISLLLADFTSGRLNDIQESLEEDTFTIEHVLAAVGQLMQQLE